MAEIILNQSEWNGLPLDARNRIQEILEQSGLLKDGDQIVALPNAPTFADIAALKLPTIPYNVCMSLCDVAQAVAHAACALLPDPISIAACNAAAIAAGNICRRTCKPAPAPITTTP